MVRSTKVNNMVEGLVSIIIPVYNEEKYICRCLDSIVSQDYDLSKCEILLVDGGSCDNTLALVEGYHELNIKVINNPDRKVTYAVNKGILNSSGEYIIRLDAHAEYDKSYISKCLYYIQHMEIDNVGGIAKTVGLGTIGSGNAEILSSKFGVGNSQFRTEAKAGFVDTVPFGTFRRSIFDEIGLFDVDLPRSEDNDFNSRIRAKGGKVFLSPDITFNYYCRDTIMGLLNQGLKNGNSLFLTIRRNPKAMSFRHFVPFLFVLSLIFGTILSFFLKFVFFGFIAELTIYFVLDLLFSLRGRKKYVFYKFLMFPMFHISYGIGSLIGLFNIKLY